jgi:RHH-type transcriptional regulator, rel operon repressor / antitoxin RelB
MYTYESNQPEHHHVSAADSTVVTARIDAALKAKLEALSRTTKRSKSYLAAEAIAAYVELNEWQIAELEAGIAELDAGEVLSEEEAEERYRRLLQPL